MSAQTPLSHALAEYETRIGGKFSPGAVFYERVGINRKRFGQLVRGEKPLLVPEAKSLATEFGLPLETLIN